MTRPPLDAWLAGDDEPGEPAEDRRTDGDGQREAPVPDDEQAWDPGGDHLGVATAPEDDWDHPDPPPRGRRVWLMALTPWMIVGGLLLAWQVHEADPPQPQPGQTQPAESDAVQGREETDPAAAPAEPDPRAVDDPVPVAPGGGVPDGAVASRVAAAATTAVRLHVVEAPGGAARYVDHVALEAFAPHAGGMVATVRAVVLDADEEQWAEPQVRRYGVLLRQDGEAQLVDGPPWPLPAPEPPDDRVKAQRVPDGQVEAAAEEALRTAGYAEPSELEVWRLPQAELLRVRVQATAPDDQQAAVHEVVLSDLPHVRVIGVSDPPTAPADPAPPTDPAPPLDATPTDAADPVEEQP